MATSEFFAQSAQRTYYDVRANASDADHASMVRAHDMAMTYAWGYQDASTGDTDSSEALAFAAIYALHVNDFDTGAQCFCRPIVDAFRMFRAGEAIRVGH